MRLYRTAAGFHGTQAEAKSFSRDFEQVEVPTDKEGLLAYLNGMHNAQQDREDVFHTVVARQDPPVAELRRVDTTVDLDEAFLAAPLGQQLTLAGIALEEARRALKPLVIGDDASDLLA